jgi:hypothetical protein
MVIGCSSGWAIVFASVTSLLRCLDVASNAIL